jgi:hypothetical protein
MAARQPQPSLAAEIRVVPANRATAEDLHLIFGLRGPGATCQCQRYKLRPRESFASVPVEERQQRLRDQTDCGHSRSRRTSGLVGYLGDEPVGWCAVEPRPAYEGLVRVFRVPWDGRGRGPRRRRCGGDHLPVHPRWLPSPRGQPRHGQGRR